MSHPILCPIERDLGSTRLRLFLPSGIETVHVELRDVAL